MIIRRVHQRQLHAGVNQTLAASRQRYWIARGRNAVKNVIRQCVTCRRSVGQPFGQKMGELPAERVIPTGPFWHVDVEFIWHTLIWKMHISSSEGNRSLCLTRTSMVRAPVRGDNRSLTLLHLRWRHQRKMLEHL
ncbi:Retrovirus-related Pol polyprotein from transposon 17.6 [Trichinella pseudospiralis]